MISCVMPFFDSADRYTILNDLAVASRVVQADSTAKKVHSSSFVMLEFKYMIR